MARPASRDLTWSQCWLALLILTRILLCPLDAAAQVRASDLENDPASARPVPAPPAPHTVAPVALPRPSPQVQRLELLNRQIEAMEEDEPGLRGPITLTFVGCGASTLLLGVGILDHTSQAGSTSGHIPTLAPIAFAMSGIGAAVGLIGGIWWLIRVDDRRLYFEKLESLQKQRDQIGWDLKSERGGVSGSLKFAF